MKDGFALWITGLIILLSIYNDFNNGFFVRLIIGFSMSIAGTMLMIGKELKNI